MEFLEIYFNKFFLSIKKNDIIYAKIIKITKKFVILDANLKKECYIKKREFIIQDQYLEVKLGDFVEILIISTRNMNFSFSRCKFKDLVLSKFLKIILEKKKFVKGHIKHKVKGGFIVYIKNIKCFLPYSFTDKKLLINPFYQKKHLINFRIVKFNFKKKSIILSRKLYSYWFRVLKKKKFFNLLKAGNYIKGIVKSFNNFGMYIDFGHFLGFVKKHIIFSDPYKYFNETLSINQSLLIKIVKKNPKDKTIFLNIKRSFYKNFKFFLGSKLYFKIYKINYKYIFFVSRNNVFVKIKKKYLLNLKLNSYKELLIFKIKKKKFYFKPLLAQRIEQWPSKS